MYCEKCKIVFDGERCPQCRKKRARQVRDDDMCFVTKQPQLLGEMLADVLAQEGIPVFLQGVLGAGLSTVVGRNWEQVKVYVPYARYERARELADSLLSGEAVWEDEMLPDAQEESE